MDQDLPADGRYLCHGITWASGAPGLLLVPLGGGRLVHAPVMGRRLGYRAEESGRWCTGRYRFADRFRVEPDPCPGMAASGTGSQCAACGGRDEFRFAHHVHTGGPVPQALALYMNQPHWLYVATFADTTTKVGTAAEPRWRSRLDEQGPLVATYLAKGPDGSAVRFVEDALTRRLDLTQTVRATAKLQGLARLSDTAPAHDAHARHVRRAAEVLTELGIPVDLQPWTPPEQSRLASTPGADRLLYPHDLREGEHGLRVHSVAGSQALVTLSGDSLHYLLDLSALKGRRITLGAHFRSPPATVQPALF
ncbi:DUF2797 domain-containing protein [Streptomyces sp. NBC_01237]|uniref:DUF2797 domain-containing protein n=1 Tax=Streptomyces sp. NBC_01237 TaxID=2903790 RepID=UPI002DD9F04E|nr:DUF2797 domain-containing protein [Streptomyces sp. NBC_01237]WRZ77266.1 DUF2797 domain-containing protein [Streptomyces sp. NBC_01237]